MTLYTDDAMMLAPGAPMAEGNAIRDGFAQMGGMGVTAIDLQTGDHAWMIANGDTPAHVAERLGLDPATRPRTGKASRAGLLVTRTLLFAGEGLSGDPVFRAHDKATGEILAEIEIPGTQTGLPMTYLHEGRQFIVLSVGGRGMAPELVALALLPEA